MLALPEHSLSTLDVIHHMDALSLLRGMRAGSVDAVITDMTYGKTEFEWDVVIDLVQWWQQIKRVLKPEGVMITTAVQPFTSVLVMSNPTWFKYEWIWHKNQATQMMNARYRPMMEHENILVFSGMRLRGNQFVTDRAVYNPQGVRSIAKIENGKTRASGIYHVRSNLNKRYIKTMTDFPKTILRFDVEVGSHPTQKPVALYEYLIRTYSNEGDLIVDPFMGSGTTAIAARNTGRHFIGCDTHRPYVELARQRLAATDPYQHTPLSNGMRQMSLFAEN